ncbi:hypothetical protein AB0L97_27335 [Nocardia sp. NPDC051911]|uniref:hypothetical protein n=1 Tax=Nocardia sp. NPDC051911 TaxID=3154648 RepID=UPI00343E0694
MNPDRVAREARKRQRDPQAIEARNRRLNKMSKGSLDLLDSVADRLPPDLVESYRAYSDVGEWAMLVDVLCASLIKRRIPVTEAERDAVANVLGQFSPPVEGYRYLNDPQGVLSELNVVNG